MSRLISECFAFDIGIGDETLRGGDHNEAGVDGARPVNMDNEVVLMLVNRYREFGMVTSWSTVVTWIPIRKRDGNRERDWLSANTGDARVNVMNIAPTTTALTAASHPISPPP